MKNFFILTTYLFSFLISNYAYSQKVYIISDIDDTIKITGLKAGTKEMIEQGSVQEPSLDLILSTSCL